MSSPPKFDRWFFDGFVWYCRGYVGRRFAAVRVSGPPAVDPGPDVPVVVFMNHPSWWDPLLAAMAARRDFPHRRHYGPIDAESLAKFRSFRRLGFFGVEKDSARGAKSFLRASRAILAEPGATIWITPQGRFADVRERPLGFEPGLGWLAAQLTHGVFLPLALEYPFWDEPAPQAVLRFGTPIRAEAEPGLDRRGWTARLEAALAATLDELRAEVETRDSSRFTILAPGRRGLGGWFGWLGESRAAFRRTSPRGPEGT